jgi:hypothetical protein
MDELRKRPPMDCEDKFMPFRSRVEEVKKKTRKAA